MKKIFSEEAFYTKMNIDIVIDRFCSKWNKEEFKESFVYMKENGIDFFSDTMLADGSYNKNWVYALHLVVDEDYKYIALTVRDEEY